jgi:hypothetical protein
MARPPAQAAFLTGRALFATMTSERVKTHIHRLYAKAGTRRRGKALAAPQVRKCGALSPRLIHIG